MKKKLINNNFFKISIIIFLGIIIGLIIKYISLNIIADENMLNDIEKRITINGPINNLKIIGTKSFANKKIIVITFSINNIENWGTFIYDEVRTKYYIYETYCINNFKEDISTNIIVDNEMYHVKCTILGDITINHIY